MFFVLQQEMWTMLEYICRKCKQCWNIYLFAALSSPRLLVSNSLKFEVFKVILESVPRLKFKVILESLPRCISNSHTPQSDLPWWDTEQSKASSFQIEEWWEYKSHKMIRIQTYLIFVIFAAKFNWKIFNFQFSAKLFN